MQKNTRKQFQKCLNSYDSTAIVQHEMAHKLIQILKKYSPNSENILELGCGTGYLTKEFLKNFKCNNYFANDFVEDVKPFLPNSAEFISGNMAEIEFPQNVDIVVSNAVFQWINDLNFLFNKVNNSLKKNGYFAFSTFLPENFCEIKEVCGLTLNYKTESELKQILKQKFEVLETFCYKEVLEFPTTLDILKHMKNTGVNSLNDVSWGIKQINEFCQIYSKKYQTNRLTYNPIIILAQKL